MADNFHQDEPREPEDPTGDDLDQVLRAAFEVGQPSVVFQAKLSETLSQEYAALFSRSASSEEASVQHFDTDASEFGVVSFDGASIPNATSTTNHRLRRVLKWGAAAACLLIAATWWSTGSRYSWASMIAAVERSEWVQIVLRLDSDESTTAWFSGEHHIAAIRTEDGVQYDDLTAQSRLWYATDGNAIAHKEMKNAAVTSSEGRFVELILGNQTPQGHWQHEVKGGQTDSQFGVTYTTALAILSLTPPYQLLPIYQR